MNIKRKLGKRDLSTSILLALISLSPHLVLAATPATLGNITATSNWGSTQWNTGSYDISLQGDASTVTVERTIAGLGTFGWDTPSDQNNVLTFINTSSEAYNTINIKTIASGKNVTSGVEIPSANTVIGLYNAGANINAKNTNFNIDINYETPVNATSSPVAYAVLAGSSVNAGVNSNTPTRSDTTVYSDIHVHNLTIKQSITDNYFLKDYGIYSLNSGIRSIQGAYKNPGGSSTSESGLGGAGRVIVDGNFDMTLDGGRQEGIYISGQGAAEGSKISTVILNGDSKITLLNGEGTDNSAIKIGKSRAIGTGAGILESHGNMIINMDGTNGTNTETAAIKLAVSGSTLKADYDTSSTTVTTKNGNVLNIGYNDWGTQVASTGISTSFRNANFTTGSTTHSMLQVFKNQGAVNLSFSGSGTKLNMGNNQSWILNVDNSDDSNYTNNVNYSLKNGGIMTGLIHQDGNGSIHASLDNGSEWLLNKNIEGTETTFTDLTLTNAALVDASADNFTMTGNVNNTSGIINLDDGSNRTIDSSFKTLTIQGNYIGGVTPQTSGDLYPNGNGTIVVGTVWNNENESKTDLLHITGTATGYTQVETASGIVGNIVKGNTAKQSATVIQVDDHSQGANAFYGFANTIGAGQALLVQANANDYVWQIDGLPVNPVKPETSSEVATPRINSEMGFAFLDSLHQRVGEQQSLNYDSKDLKETQTGKYDDHQIWARVIGRRLEENGENRFGYTSNIWGIQIGKDLKVKYNVEDGIVKERTHSGIMLSYSRANSSFRDGKYVIFNEATGDYESIKQTTGSGSTDMFALGGYYTRYKADGTYLDLVGSVMRFNNKYTPMETGSYQNHAWGFALSAEIGKPIPMKNNWKFEPQGQLIWQHLRSSAYNDSTARVDPGTTNAVRGRLGFRLTHQKDEKNSSVFYVTGNILHDFTGSQSIDIGADRLQENWSRTWLSLGIGGQRLVSNDVYLYGDLRYEHSIGGGGDRKNWVGNVGLRYLF